MEQFSQFINSYGIYLVVASMLFCAIGVIYKPKKEKRERWTVRFQCGLCGGNGEARNDPLFDCSCCNGTGVISFPVEFGHSIWLEHTSRLDYQASFNESQAKRFLGFMPIGE